MSPPIWRFPVTEVRRVGWLVLTLAATVVGASFLMLAEPARSAAASAGAYRVAMWFGILACWARLLRAPEQGRRAVAFGILAAALLTVSYGWAVINDLLTPGSEPPGWLGVAVWLAGPAWVGLLLSWPVAHRTKRPWAFVTLDSSIVLLAAGLLVWNFWFVAGRPPVGRELFAAAVPLGSALVLLVGVNLAAVRPPQPEFRIPFRLVLAAVTLTFFSNFGMAVLRLPPALTERIVVPAEAAIFLCYLAAAESIRLGWRPPRSKAQAVGTSPAPWAAVALIALFVIQLGISSPGKGIGPVVIGAVLTMALLIARQIVTMNENARLQAERAALEAEARVAGLVRHASDVMMIVNPDLPGLPIRYISPSAREMWGQDVDWLMATDFRPRLHPGSQPELDLVVAECLARPGTSVTVRCRVIGKNEAVRLVDAVVTDLRHEPSIQGVVITLRDQTERVLLEEQLHQAQKMEAVGQLAGGVAHDFNNLLTTILGHCELALDSLDQGSKIRDDLGQIKRAGELAASLTRQLLAFSRKQVVEKKPIQIATLLDETTRMLRRLIKEHVTTVLEIAPDVGWVEVDSAQLEQVIMNLAVNARDAMPGGGRLTIRARREQVNGDLRAAVVPAPLGDCVVVEVEDTGTGMDAETQKRIFEPFFTTKPVGQGTGLGLSSVYGIVQQNGAGLTLRSAPGEGTTFGVYLSRLKAGAGAGADDASRSREPVSATILLVEDEDALRDIANRVLVREGYRVLMASNADDALTLAASAQFPIDLLLTDVVMPGMNGARLAQELRPRRPEMRVLYMSGYPGDDLTGELGPDQRFLRKPFTPYVLLEYVRLALDSGGARARRGPAQ